MCAQFCSIIKLISFVKARGRCREASLGPWAFSQGQEASLVPWAFSQGQEAYKPFYEGCIPGNYG